MKSCQGDVLDFRNVPQHWKGWRS